MNLREYRAAIDEVTAVHSKRTEEVHRELHAAIARITDEFLGTMPSDEPEQPEYARYQDEDKIREAMTEARHHPGRTVTR